MRGNEIQALDIKTDGNTITSGASSSSTTIPNTVSGKRPTYARFACDTIAYIAVGSSTVAATSSSALLNGPASDLVLNVSGCTHWAALQKTAGAVVQCSPIESGVTI